MSMEEKNLQIQNYINQLAVNVNKDYPGLIDEEIVKKALELYKDSPKQIEEIIKEIESQKQKLIIKWNEEKKLNEELKSKFNSKNIEIKNIEELDISTISYETMEQLFFHYSWNKYLESYDKYGMKAVVGENSKGIDPEASIFFSKGVEGVLELWDVWLKWRLNRQNNPQFNGKTHGEIEETNKRFRTGQITEEEKKNWYYWIDYFKNKKYVNNQTMLKKLYEYQFTEMINSSYFMLDLKENKEFVYNQIDIKKQWAIERARKTENGIDPLTATQYGNYSDFSTPIVDKWNMQTIPGLDVTIEPDRLKKLKVKEHDDVLSVLLFMYDKYKKEIPVDRQIKFDMLDGFVTYAKDKRVKMENEQTIQAGLNSLIEEIKTQKFEGTDDEIKIQQIMYLDNYIKKNIDYGFETVEYSIQHPDDININNNPYKNAFELSGFFIPNELTGKRTAVCGSISSVASHVLNNLGIKCDYVWGHFNAGTAENPKYVGHRWNVITINEKQYMVDFTAQMVIHNANKNEKYADACKQLFKIDDSLEHEFDYLFFDKLAPAETIGGFKKNEHGTTIDDISVDGKLKNITDDPHKVYGDLERIDQNTLKCINQKNKDNTDFGQQKHEEEVVKKSEEYSETKSVESNPIILRVPEIKSFSWKSNSEAMAYSQIKQKNQIIKQQKAQQKQMNKPKVKTLTPSSQGGTGSKGFTNVVLLSLIVSFVAGALFMVMYMLLGGK